jgi:hypothetical protein
MKRTGLNIREEQRDGTITLVNFLVGEPVSTLQYLLADLFSALKEGVSSTSLLSRSAASSPLRSWASLK